MKKLLTLTFAILFSTSSYAGFMDSDYFVPTVVGSVAAGYCYTQADEGDEATQAGMCGAAGFALTYAVQWGFQKRNNTQSEAIITDLEKDIQKLKVMQANQASSGEDTSFSLKVREYMPGRKNSDGSIDSPYWRERLVPAGEGSMIGY